MKQGISTRRQPDDLDPGMPRVELPLPPKPSMVDRIRYRLQPTAAAAAAPIPRMPYPTVELSYWMPESRYAAVNFGDELSRTVVELMLARRGATLFDSSAAARQLVAVGSVLHTARNGATIWGTGLHGAMPLSEHRYTQLDVRAVRGPITRRFLRQRGVAVPEIYGDPALLLPLVANGRFAPTGEWDVGVVPNLHDQHYLATLDLPRTHPGLLVIDPLRSWNVVVADILRCRTVIASSLHGLVIAEAYGIPARYVRFTDREPMLKYEDYYGGTGRGVRPATTIDQALVMGGEAPGSNDGVALAAAFPYDLWGL